MEHLYTFKSPILSGINLRGLCRIRQNQVESVVFQKEKRTQQDMWFWDMVESYVPWKGIEFKDLPPEVKDYYKDWEESADILHSHNYWQQAEVPEGFELILKKLLFIQWDMNKQFKFVYIAIAASTAFLAALMILLHCM